jgi:hypothetical protein
LRIVYRKGPKKATSFLVVPVSKRLDVDVDGP